MVTIGEQMFLDSMTFTSVRSGSSVFVVKHCNTEQYAWCISYPSFSDAALSKDDMYLKFYVTPSPIIRLDSIFRAFTIGHEFQDKQFIIYECCYVKKIEDD